MQVGQLRPNTPRLLGEAVATSQELTVEDLFLPQRPVEPEKPHWLYRAGEWPVILGTMGLSVASTVTASFAAGGLVGRAAGLTAGSILGYGAWRVSDWLVHHFSGGNPS